MASYDYNFDNSPRDEDEQTNNFPNETSDYSVSPLENMNLGITDTIEDCASGAIDVAGKVVGAGLGVVGGFLRLFR